MDRQNEAIAPIRAPRTVPPELLRGENSVKLIKRQAHYWWTFYCPGCKREHALNPNIYDVTGDDLEHPTVNPPFRTFWREIGISDKGALRAIYQGVCQVNIVEGNLIYAECCTHSLRGQTVEMMEIEP
jgi:hypothetical protein